MSFWFSLVSLRGSGGGKRADGTIGLNEYCSGFRHIGHNDAMSVVFLWAIPK